MNTEPTSFRTFGIRHSTLLVLLTILAGMLRFYALDKPSIWGDEAATWRRTNGTYQQLIDELRTAGFMPGNYLLTWWIKDGFPVWGHYATTAPTREPDREAPGGGWFGHRGFDDPAREKRMAWTPSVRLIPAGIRQSPLMLRFVPALCGTLMVPAMYFLASRLVARRTALLVALFTACSAYMLNYSRDAKMYAQFWLFATLHVGALLWWLEAYRRPRVVEEILARRRSTKQDELAEGIAGVLPAEHVDDVARAFGGPDPRDVVNLSVGRLETFFRFLCWLTAGLAMIAFHAVGLAIVAISFLIVLATIPQRLAWIGGIKRRVFRRADPDAFEAVAARGRWSSRFCIPPLLSFLVGATCIVLLFSSYRAFTHFYDRVEPVGTDSTKFDVDDAGIGWVDPYNRGRTAGSHFLENATAYLFNWEWAKVEDMPNIDPVVLARLRLAAIVLLSAIAAGLVPWKSLLDRITGTPRERGPMSATALLIVGAWLLVPAYGFYAASGAWDAAGKRVQATPPVLTVVSTVFPDAKPGNVEPLRGALATLFKPVISEGEPFGQAWREMRMLPWRELFVVHGIGPPRWWVIGAVFASLAIAVVGWRRPRLVSVVVEPAEAPLGFRRPAPLITPLEDRTELARLRRRRKIAWLSSLSLNGAAALLALLVLLTLLVITFVVVPPQGVSVWMPRYLGFVWPAFAIVICVLIRRLPTLPLRWAVIGLLLAVNLANFRARLNYGEPPTGDMARDLITVEANKNARLFAPMLAHPKFGGPGAGGMYSMPEAYYYLTLSDKHVPPREVYGYADGGIAIRLGSGYANSIRARLIRDAKADDIYVWAQMPRTTPLGETEHSLLTTLGPAWQPAEPSERWTVFDHWTWQQTCLLDRVHLKRTGESIAPTTNPATKSVLPKIASRPSTRPASQPTTR